jgi:hypothetical protein
MTIWRLSVVRPIAAQVQSREVKRIDLKAACDVHHRTRGFERSHATFGTIERKVNIEWQSQAAAA